MLSLKILDQFSKQFENVAAGKQVTGDNIMYHPHPHLSTFLMWPFSALNLWRIKVSNIGVAYLLLIFFNFLYQIVTILSFVWKSSCIKIWTIFDESRLQSFPFSVFCKWIWQNNTKVVLKEPFTFKSYISDNNELLGHFGHIEMCMARNQIAQ